MFFFCKRFYLVWNIEIYFNFIFFTKKSCLDKVNNSKKIYLSNEWTTICFSNLLCFIENDSFQIEKQWFDTLEKLRFSTKIHKRTLSLTDRRSNTKVESRTEIFQTRWKFKKRSLEKPKRFGKSTRTNNTTSFVVWMFWNKKRRLSNLITFRYETYRFRITCILYMCMCSISLSNFPFGTGPGLSAIFRTFVRQPLCHCFLPFLKKDLTTVWRICDYGKSLYFPIFGT